MTTTLTAVPMITPSATSTNTRTSTSRTTPAGSAPSAIRMPISARRLVTAYDVTPYRPRPASSRASVPKNPVTSATRRSCVSEASTRSCSESERKREIAIDPRQCRRHTRCQQGGRPRGRTNADVDIGRHGRRPSSIALRQRYVDSRPYSITHGYVHRVAHDSDDRPWRSRVSCEHHRFSYRVPAAQELVRIGFVDQRDRKCPLRIPFVDIAAGKDGRAVGGEPSRRDLIEHVHPRVPERHRTRFGLGGRRTGQVDKAKDAATADGRGHRPTGTRDARHRGDRRDELMKEGNAIGRIDGRTRHVHVDDEYAVGYRTQGAASRAVRMSPPKGPPPR